MGTGHGGVLASIVRFSLRHRGVVIALSVLFLGYSLFKLLGAEYDVFPEFAPPQVAVQAEAPGLSPEQVEVMVTRPVENAINGVEGIESLRSSSIQGLSVVTATFRTGSDVYLDRQRVNERLTSIAGSLPQEVMPPVMVPMTSSTGDLMVIGLTSKKRSLMELRTIADWVVRPHLEAVPGVSKAAVFGGEVRQLQIQLQPDRLVRYGLAIDDVVAAAERATGISGAGFLDNENQRLIMQTEGQSLTAGQLARTVLRHEDGAVVTLDDVADVIDAPEPRISAASVMGRPGVVLNLWTQYGANTVEVTRRLDKAFEELRPSLEAEKVTMRTDLFRAASFIDTAIGNVRESLAIGAVLVLAVLVLFLFNLRTAAISCAAIPLSLLAAVTVMGHLGYSLNTMTLGGLAIAVGDVVDDAIINVENILRRLRENRLAAEPRPAFRVILDASLEVQSAVVFPTLAVALVFIPVLTLPGLAGRLFFPLGAAYIIATLASLAVAMTVTPALCLVLLGGRGAGRTEPPVLRILDGVRRHPRVVLGGVLILAAAGFSTLPFLGTEFLPELREGHFLAHMTAIPGTSLEESQRLGNKVTRALFTFPAVRTVAQRVGRAEADDTFGPHSSEFEIDLKPLKGREAASAQSRIRDILGRFPGVNFSVNTFLTERVEETISGYTASVVVNVFGNDLDDLDAKAARIAKVLSTVGGAADIQVQSPPGTPQLIVRLRKDDLVRWGLLPLDVLDAVRTAYQGTAAGQVYEGNRVFDVSVILDPKSRRSPLDVGDLPLRNPGGTIVRLRQVADVYETSGRYVVLHEAARRVQTVTCNVSGRDVGSFVDEARRKILEGIRFTAGSTVEFGGAAEEQARSRRDLLVHSLFAGVGIVLLLAVVMGSWRNLLLVLVNLPFALVGGLLAVLAAGGTMSIGSLVGFVTVFGITLRSSIMMMTHYGNLVRVEGAVWGAQTAMRGASDRLAPILMTAAVTALGLLPLALGSGAPGREIEGPMAVVILGGLATATLLNLLVLPALALRYGRFAGAADAA
jgi:CzcA family heavy metal efflux pump